jgi:alpha-tubulin suppressor-like RCC1 family protein
LLVVQVVGGGIERSKIVAVTAGYVHWAALSSSGRVWTCNTGFDGYVHGRQPMPSNASHAY